MVTVFAETSRLENQFGAVRALTFLTDPGGEGSFVTEAKGKILQVISLASGTGLHRCLFRSLVGWSLTELLPP
jgi:hypothetical protein